eukprot:jgi/Chrzof1/7918/Cz02g41080.t1_PSB27C[v5.2]
MAHCTGAHALYRPARLYAARPESSITSCSCSQTTKVPVHQHKNARRQVLLTGMLLSLAGNATADVSDHLATQLPSTNSNRSSLELPKAYRNTASKLVSTLKATIQAEADGAEEREVRRTADPAKEQVREFVGKWRDDPAVRGDVSHSEIIAALEELGAFYRQQGPRARLSRAVRERILGHLSAVEAALPAEPDRPKSLLGL